MFKKLKFLIPNEFKFGGIILLILMLIGMILESFGLGLLLPIVNFIIDPEKLNEYPSLIDLTEKIGIKNNIQLITLAMSLYSALYIFKVIFLLFLYKKQADFSFGISSRITNKLYSKYINDSYINNLNRNSASMFRNTTAEVTNLSSVFQYGLMLSTEIAISISIILTLFYVDFFGAISIFIFFLIMGSILYFSLKGYIYNLGLKKLEFDEERTKLMVQGYNAYKEINIFNKHNFFIHNFKKFSNKYFQKLRNLFVVQQIPRLYLELISVIGLSIFIISSIGRGVEIENTIAVLSVFALGAFRLIPSVNRILTNIQAVRYALPSIELLYNEFIKLNKNQNELKHNNSLSFKNSIELNKISYKYPETEKFVLKDLYLKIIEGSTIGIIGESGSGKSTLIDILTGLIKPNMGSFSVDSKKLDNNSGYLNLKVGYVPQTIFLLDDSLKNNIAFGIEESKINVERINEVLKDSQITNFVNSLEDGIETNVGERGMKLSGGQRQRIGIARALYFNPELLVLDEGTSSLDSKTEYDIMESINYLKGKKTIILVAHRYSTLKECDVIYKLENGKFTKSGNFKQMKLS